LWDNLSVPSSEVNKLKKNRKIEKFRERSFIFCTTLLTDQVTQWSKVVLEILIFPHLVKKKFLIL
jgi:hypothetical protein